MRVPSAVVGAVAALLVVPAASASPLGAVSPAKIERALIAGRSVVYDNATIQGDINLSDYAAGKVEGPFVCNYCTFNGSIIAPHVVFEREFDLSGSTIKGDVDLHGALFMKPALFKQTVFDQDAEFDVAEFNDLAVFRGSTFAVASGFNSAQFHSVARFGDAQFGDAASFSDAIFAAEALFGGALFTGVAEFPDAVFGSASDFREASFLGGEQDSEPGASLRTPISSGARSSAKRCLHMKRFFVEPALAATPSSSRRSSEWRRLLSSSRTWPFAARSTWKSSTSLTHSKDLSSSEKCPRIRCPSTESAMGRPRNS